MVIYLKTIALIAHDRKKDLMVKLVTAYRFILEKHEYNKNREFKHGNKKF